MKEAGASKYVHAEQTDKERLQSREKPSKASAPHESKTDAPVAQPSGGEQILEVPEVDLGGDPEAAHDVAEPDLPEPMSAEAGIEMEDTSFL